MLGEVPRVWNVFFQKKKLHGISLVIWTMTWFRITKILIQRCWKFQPQLYKFTKRWLTRTQTKNLLEWNCLRYLTSISTCRMRSSLRPWPPKFWWNLVRMTKGQHTWELCHRLFSFENGICLISETIKCNEVSFWSCLWKCWGMDLQVSDSIFLGQTAGQLSNGFASVLFIAVQLRPTSLIRTWLTSLQSVSCRRSFYLLFLPSFLLTVFSFSSTHLTSQSFFDTKKALPIQSTHPSLPSFESLGPKFASRWRSDPVWKPRLPLAASPKELLPLQQSPEMDINFI